MTIMTFGQKYRDQPLEDVPTDYLRWALANCSRMKRHHRELLGEELKARGEHPPEKRSFEVASAGIGFVERFTYEHTWGRKGGEAVRLRLVKWREQMLKLFVPEGDDDDWGSALGFVVEEGFKMMVELLSLDGSVEETV